MTRPPKKSNVGKAGEHWETWAGEKGERKHGIRRRGLPGWHHEGLEHRLLDPGVRYSTGCEGCWRFMAAWTREEEKASKKWHK